MYFFKYCGAGNDFVLLDNRDGQWTEYADLARRLCDRHFGIGADGLMLLEQAEQGGDVKMVFYNNDGSPAEMCGNGARCICRHCHDFGLSGEVQRIETPAGLVTGRRISETEYQIALNPVSVFEPQEDCTYVELGTPGIPHAVVPCDLGESRESLREFAKRFRYRFPRGANVNLWQFTGDNAIRLMTFERGVEDFTLACGTGTGSAVYALWKAGLVTGQNTAVQADGGLLHVSIEAGRILLTGPALRTFTGELSL